MKLRILAIITAIFTSSCGHNHNQDTVVHAHDETLQLTAYNADFEVFAEARPFVVGIKSDIVAHCSFLDNFKPLVEGSITASLVIGENKVSQTVNQPVRTGIYLFEITPAITGRGLIRFDIETPQGKSQILVSDVVVYTNEHEAHEAAAAAAIANNNGAVFTKEQSWKVDFATAEARLEPFGQIIRTMAQIQPSQGDEQIISAKISGAAFFTTNITEGKVVAAGQSLFTIDGSTTADNNLAVRYAEVESEYNRAKAEYERKTELAGENIVSQSDLLKAKTDFVNAETNYNNLKNNFTAGKQSVSSPIGGFVTRVFVQNGQYVEAGQPVIVVSQNRDLLLKAELQPRFYDLLDKITTANIRFLNANRTCSLEELGGRLLSYGKSTDINNPLIPVIFQVGAYGNTPLLPGSIVEMFIKTQTSDQAVTVPNEAIIEEMGNFFVYMQLTPELFEKRPVKTGVTDGIRIEITEGITAGDRVVSKGAIMVKLAQASGTLDAHAGHVH